MESRHDAAREGWPPKEIGNNGSCHLFLSMTPFLIHLFLSIEFNIPYELYGTAQVYEPEFLVKLKNDMTVIVEIKGQTREDTDAKHQGAKRWVAAVNRWGKLGKWDFVVCRGPATPGKRIAVVKVLCRQRNYSMR
jgi:hypothetical protein